MNTWGTGMNARQALAVTLIMTCITTQRVVSQEGIWASTPLGGGAVKALHVTALGTVYASGNAGLFRSTDDGHTWEATRIGLPAGEVVFPIVSRPDGTTFAGAGKQGYRSVDGGRTWSPLGAGLPRENIAAMIALDSGVVIAGYLRDGMYRSADGGQTWDRPAAGVPEGASALAFVVMPSGDLIAGSEFGLFRSEDEGQTWSLIVNVPENLRFVLDLAVAPNGVDGVVAAASFDGIFLSTDAGVSWEDRTWPREIASNTRAYSVAVTAAGDILAGSVDGLLVSRGGSWEVSMLMDGIGPHAEILTDGTILLGQIVGDEGILRSDDEGRTWSRSNTGYTNGTVVDLALSDRGVIVAAAWGGLFRSTDDGVTWNLARSASNHGLNVAAGPSGVLLASSGPINSLDAAGLLRSDDHGETWREFKSGLPTGRTDVNIVIEQLDVTSRGTAFLGFHDGIQADGSWVWRSYRSGKQSTTWEQWSDGPFPLPGLSASNPEPSFVNLPDGRLLLHFEPAGGVGQIYVTGDDGTTWERIFSDSPRGLRIDAVQTDGTLWGRALGFGGRTLACSEDGGRTWKSIPAPPDVTILLRVYAAPNATVWLAGRTREGSPALLSSTDGGATWNEYSTGLSADVNDVVFAPGGRALAASGGSGVYWRDLHEAATAVLEREAGGYQPVRAALGHGYPNPFNPTTTIPFELSRPTAIHLEVFDVLGQSVRVLMRESVAAGSHTVIWDGTDEGGMALAGGVYFCRLRVPGIQHTRRLTLLK